jgi:hypothetical protein
VATVVPNHRRHAIDELSRDFHLLIRTSLSSVLSIQENKDREALNEYPLERVSLVRTT